MTLGKGIKGKRETLSFSALSGSITSNEDTWLIDSGASKHMTGYRRALTDLSERSISAQVELGNDAKYYVKGIGSAAFELNSGESLKMTNILFVPGLKKNLISVSALEDKGYVVAFSSGKVLVWEKNSSMKSAVTIGIREGGLYTLLGKPVQALVHNDVNLSELWHRRFAHLHYRALPSMKNLVSGFPELQVDHDGVCKGCALGKNVKASFPGTETRPTCILDLMHFDVCRPM